MKLGGSSAERRKHGLFGLTLASDFPFESRLGRGRGEPDLSFSSLGDPPADEPLAEPVYESSLRDESGNSLVRLYRLPDGELLRFGDALDFYLGRRRIDYRLRDPGWAEAIEVRFLGTVLSYWLERLEVCVLHASAVVADGRALAFMANNRGGKSALAAAMMSAGAPLLTDDVLPVEPRGGEIVARSGYPQMRMWPDALSHFGAGTPERSSFPRRFGKHWVPVGSDGFGEFHAAAAPLGRVYLPRREDQGTPSGEVRISELPPREAVIELLRCSFSPNIVEAVGLQRHRLETFARLVEQVPVRRLSYPSGLEALPRIRRAVLADLATGS